MIRLPPLSRWMLLCASLVIVLNTLLCASLRNASPIASDGLVNNMGLVLVHEQLAHADDHAHSHTESDAISQLVPISDTQDHLHEHGVEHSHFESPTGYWDDALPDWNHRLVNATDTQLLCVWPTEPIFYFLKPPIGV
jgi:hypothetical protein